MSVTQFKFAGALVLAISVVAAMSALAATDPYPTGLTGYDVSYPQCGGTAAAGSFGIVGVNGGGPLPHKTSPGAGDAGGPPHPPPPPSITQGCAHRARGAAP